MGKIKIKIVLNNEANNYKAIKQDDVITYKDKNGIVIIKLNENIIIRKNKNYDLTLSFIENKVTNNEYYLKKEGIVNVDIYTEKITRGNKYLKIKYRVIDGDEMVFEMEEL